MILNVTEKYHDHYPIQYFIDTDKLDLSNHVDSEIAKACKKKSNKLEVFIDASNWESNPKFKSKDTGEIEEPHISADSIVKKTKELKAEKMLYLEINFDC